MGTFINAADYGIFSLLPPIIAMLFVITTHEVLFSLFVGILAGAFIYEHFNIYNTMKTAFDTIIIGISKDPGKLNILIFLALLGALVVILTMSGGAKAYGDWAAKKIKNKSKAQLITCFLGLVFSVDDYFHFLASSVIMKPVTQKHKVSNAKLAYLLDSTAAPLCVIMPISSWSAAIISMFAENGIQNSMRLFIRTIPYNFYSIFTIVLVLIFSVNKFEFGKMAKLELAAAKQTKPSDNAKDEETPATIEGLPINEHGKAIYMILPIVILVVATFFCMLKTGNFFGGNVSLFRALETSNVGESLVIGSFLALVSAFLLLVPKRIVGFRNFMAGIIAGVKTMLVAFLILILAWAMGCICSPDYLNTGAFLKATLSSAIPMQLFPIVMFAISCVLSFATGTSWGTFGIFIPLVITLCSGMPERILIISISATLAGSVFGDHVSPISDTTVLAATGAGCNYLEHVYSQMPYAITAALVSCTGYLIAGFCSNVLLIWSLCFILLVLLIAAAKYITNKKAANANL